MPPFQPPEPPLTRSRVRPLPDQSAPRGKKTYLLGVLFGILILVLGGFILFVVQNSQANQSPPHAASLPALHTPPPKTPTAQLSSPSVTPTPTATDTTPPTATTKPPSSPTSPPSPSPTLFVPTEAAITNIVGHAQALPLSCEASSAVDWAAYFGYTIDEISFLNGIPLSDNPEKGFVGDVEGLWGQIPPNPYGVHAEPVAKRLRSYGIPAQAVKGMSLDALKAEIAAGRPVITWVVSHVYRGTPIPYQASDGESCLVAKFEHTVIVIGYDKHKFTFLDGDDIYQRYKKEFIRSWSVLGNMAIIWDE